MRKSWRSSTPAFVYVVFYCAFTLGLLLTLGTYAYAAINPQVPFYGTLQNTSGSPLDGTYDMVFRFYDAASGGTLLDTSTHTAANGNPVTVADGEFSVLLGSGSGNALNGVDFDTAAIYVGLTVESDSEMSPRTRLGAAPYAFNADTVDGLDASDFVQRSGTSSVTANSADTAFTVRQNGAGDVFNLLDGATEVLTVLNGGNVGIGTSTPSHRFVVAGDVFLTGAIYDNNHSAGTNGMVLQSTATGFQWVATSTLGLGAGAATLAALTDTSVGGAVSGELLVYNGSSWVNRATSTLNIAISDLAGDTDNLTEGATNLFYTNARVSSYVSGSTTITRLGQAIAVDELASADFGDFTCNGVTCSLDNSTVASSTLSATNWTNRYILQASSSAPGGFAWVATSTLGLNGSSVSFGAVNQIPFMNAGGTDFDYSTSLTTDGTSLAINAVFSTENILQVEETSFDERLGSTTVRFQSADSLTGNKERSGNLLLLEESYSSLSGTGIVSGNTLSLDRYTLAAASGVISTTGALANMVDYCEEISGTCTSSNDVLRLAQNTVSNTGAVLNITSASTNGGHIFRANDDGTFTDTTPFVIDQIGQVGIGTSAPSALLSVENTGSGNSLVIADEASDASPFIIDAAGLIRIGSSTPQTNVQFLVDGGLSADGLADSIRLLAQSINDPGRVGGAIDIFAGHGTFSSSGSGGSINIVSGNGGTSGGVAGDIYLTTGIANGTYGDVLLVSNGGNVGIGDTSPAYLFTVGNGDLFGVNSLGLIATQSVASSSLLSSNWTNGYILVASTTASGGFDWIAAADIGAGPTFGTDNQIPFTNAGGTDYDYSPSLTFDGTSLLLQPVTNAETAEVISVIYSENLNGTNRTGNLFRLDEENRAGLSPSSVLDSTVYVTRNNGNGPSAALTVSAPVAQFIDDCTFGVNCTTSSADVMQLTQLYANNTGTTLNITSATTNGGFVFRANDDGTLTDSTPFVIDQTGQVGIGTSTPNSKLTVAGDINLDGDYGLNVLGTRYFYASSSLRTIAIGELAGENFDDTSMDMIAIGYQAGQNASSSGANYRSIYIGRGAGQNAVGSDIIAIGNDAAVNASPGSHLTAIGVLAGAVSEGFSNIFIGQSAGIEQVTGDRNVALGDLAGQRGVGSDNVLLGYEAGRFHQGTSTTAVGSYALRSVVANADAINNTALGYRAGYAIDDGGSNNIFIGYQAADSLSTGANNIIIGYDVEAPSNTGSNQLNIGNLVFGTGIDGTGTAISSGNIGVGTSSPSSKLTAYGDLFLEGSNRYLNFGTATGTGGYGIRDNSGTIEVKSSGGSWAAVATSGQASLFTDGGAITYLTSTTDELSIGSVSNGTAKLNVQGEGTSDILNLFGSGGGEQLTVLSNGNLGIYDTSPDALIEITDAGTGFDYIAVTSFGGTDGDLFLVDAAGNVGIGTTSPASKLDVWGDFRVGTGSTPTLFADTSRNFVGIGTTSPTVYGLTATITPALDVWGQIRVGDDSGNFILTSNGERIGPNDTTIDGLHGNSFGLLNRRTKTYTVGSAVDDDYVGFANKISVDIGSISNPDQHMTAMVNELKYHNATGTEGITGANNSAWASSTGASSALTLDWLRGSLTQGLQQGGVSQGTYGEQVTAFLYNSAEAVSLYGDYKLVQLLSGSQATTTYGDYISIVDAGGTIGTAYGEYIAVGNSTNGTEITNGYGLYLTDVLASSNQFGIYQAGYNDINYFAGQSGFGTTSSLARLSIQATSTNDILNLFDTSGAEVFTVLENGNIGVGSSTPTSVLSIETSSVSDGIALSNTGVPADRTYDYDGVSVYTQDDETILQTASDEFYIGYSEPFSGIHLDIAVPAALTNSDGIVLYYYNGSNFNTQLAAIDYTNDLAQDGSILFNVPEDWSTTTLGPDGTARYWIRLRATSPTFPATLETLPGAVTILSGTAFKYAYTPNANPMFKIDNNGQVTIGDSMLATQATTTTALLSLVGGRNTSVSAGINQNRTATLYIENTDGAAQGAGDGYGIYNYAQSQKRYNNFTMQRNVLDATAVNQESYNIMLENIFTSTSTSANSTNYGLVNTFSVKKGDYYGVSNSITGVRDNAYGVYTTLSSDGVETATLYGSQTHLKTSITGDIAYGSFYGDSTSTGGTQYGIYIDLDDPDITGNSIYVVGDSLPSYLGSTTTVGTTTTGARLTVQSQGTSDILNLFETSGTEVFTVLENGNVGIGSSTPNKLLSVNGDADINTLTIGLGGGQISSNTAVGQKALSSNTTGTHNTALGRDALSANLSGSFSTAIGQGTLEFYTGSQPMTAVGAGALNVLQAGTFNTAVGTYAMLNATNTNYNTALGHRALQKVLSGSYNTAIGGRAMWEATTTSANNTSLGYSSLGSLTTGNNNVAIGYQTGDNLTTGSSNLIIGYNIDAPTATADNQLNIGNLIFSEGIDGTGTTISSGNIGIGSTSPMARLSIDGANTGLSNQYLLYVKGNEIGGNAIDDDGDGSVDETEDVIFDFAGNVGVGSTSPNAKLTVEGDVYVGGSLRATGTVTFSSLATGGSNECLQVDTNGVISATGASCGGGSSLFTDGGATTYLTSLTDALAVGTTSSSTAKLNVWGDFRVGTSTTPLVFADTANQFVSIGTSSQGQLFGWGDAGALLHLSGDTIGGTTRPGIILTEEGVGQFDAGVLSFQRSSVAADRLIGAIEFQDVGTIHAYTDENDSTAGYMAFSVDRPGGTLSSQEAMRLTSLGHMLIGTTTATTSARLTVQSTTTIDILNLFETDGAEVFTVLENGNVGIGTTSPYAKLSIEGLEDTALIALGDATNSKSASIYTGTTSPQSRISAPPGSLFVDTVNGLTWQKVSGTGNTGWERFSTGTTSTATTTHGASVSNSTNQSIAHSVQETVDFDTVVFDNGGIEDTGNNAISVRRTGMYIVTANVRIDSMPDEGNMQLALYVEGSIEQTNSVGHSAVAGTYDQSVEISDVLYLNAGDTVRVDAIYTSPTGSGNVNILGSTAFQNSRLTVVEIPASYGNGDTGLFTDTATTTYLTNLTRNFAVGTSTSDYRSTIWGDLFVGTSSVADLLVQTGSGFVGIGTNTPTANLDVLGTIRFESLGSGGSNLITDANGNVTVSSDERLKSIAGTYESGLEAILQIEPIQYHWATSTGYDTVNLYTGFSAQNVQLALPEAVSEDKQGFLTLADRPILAAVINAVKELWEMVTGNTERINELEERVLQLEAALDVEYSPAASSSQSSSSNSNDTEITSDTSDSSTNSPSDTDTASSSATTTVQTGEPESIQSTTTQSTTETDPVPESASSTESSGADSVETQTDSSLQSADESTDGVSTDTEPSSESVASEPADVSNEESTTGSVPVSDSEPSAEPVIDSSNESTTTE